MSNFKFERWTPEKIQHFTFQRAGETRIGDPVSRNQLETASFVVLGISESVGPVANRGFSGAENAFNSFCQAFLNTQAHDRFPATDIHFLGEIYQTNETDDPETAASWLTELDTLVEETITKFTRPHQLPIVIGGGHNNALPIIRALAKRTQLHVINIDPHADCREMSSRHSGNPFSNAISEKSLKSYSVLGLHEAYNNQFIRDFLKANNCFHRYFEDYLSGEAHLYEDVFKQFEEHPNQKIGIEIDLDSIAMMPSSAFSPSGWRVDDIRSLLLILSGYRDRIAYLHLPEAAPKIDYENKIVGKTLSYFVRDFLRRHG
ncbi:MAG: hypothetical protein RL264_2793 [Bacteroidota bacterium]|jgi:formiminoglutamase